MKRKSEIIIIEMFDSDRRKFNDILTRKGIGSFKNVFLQKKKKKKDGKKKFFTRMKWSIQFIPKTFTLVDRKTTDPLVICIISFPFTNINDSTRYSSLILSFLVFFLKKYIKFFQTCQNKTFSYQSHNGGTFWCDYISILSTYTS